MKFILEFLGLIGSHTTNCLEPKEVSTGCLKVHKTEIAFPRSSEILTPVLLQLQSHWWAQNNLEIAS